MVTKHEATVTLGPFKSLPVRYEYEPGSPGRMYMPNGDPGYPPEPAELWITDVYIEGAWVSSSKFPDDWIEPAEEWLLDKCQHPTDDREPDDDPQDDAEPIPRTAPGQPYTPAAAGDKEDD